MTNLSKIVKEKQNQNRGDQSVKQGENKWQFKNWGEKFNSVLLFFK